MNNEELLDDIFFHYFNQKLQELENNKNVEFAYYSSLEVIHYILTDGKIWLRNASCMNDFMEIRRGQDLFEKYFQAEENRCKFRRIFNQIDSNFNWEEKLLQVIRDFPISAIYDCYLASLTVHDKKDDDLGKLSMWRGYGRGIGGALVLNKEEILSRDIKGISLSKVAYFTYEEFAENFNELLANIELHVQQFKSIGAQNIWQHLRRAVLFAIVSIKHPGFREEKEWRLLCFDSDTTNDKRFLDTEIVVISGVPQKIYTLNIKKILPELLDHAIIGPTQYGIVAYTALKDDILKLYEGKNYLKETLVRNKLKSSMIPIRTDCL